MALSRIVYLLLILTLVAETAIGADLQQAPDDIRLLIDISGSMKKNDPHNLRIPAVNLMIKLSPTGIAAGVWTFGQQVNGLIPYQKTDSAWKANALALSKNINSTGLYTNIGAVLEAVMLNKSVADSLPGTAILLTDGVVDISPDPLVNKAERTRILKELLPILVTSGATIHTVALSENADAGLLKEISHATGGLFEVASSAEDLTRIFLRMFDDAVRQDRLPIEGGVFEVDSSVEEFTLLVFSPTDSTAIQLRSPENEYYLRAQHPDYISWYQDTGFELITVKRPVEGSWKLFADADPQNRVTILSDLQLQVSNLSNKLEVDEAPTVDVNFTQDGELVLDEKFLSLMDVQLIVKRPSGKLQARRLKEPVKGVYASSLDIFVEPGRYVVKVSVDGRTFKREMVQVVDYEQALILTFDKNTKELTLSSLSTRFSDEKLTVKVSVKTDGKLVSNLAMSLNDNGHWVSSLASLNIGHYEVMARIEGTTKANRYLDISSATKVIELTANNVLEVASALTDGESNVADEPFWRRYFIEILVGIGNLLVVILLAWFFVVRKRNSSGESLEVEEDEEGEDDVPPQTPAVESPVEVPLLEEVSETPSALNSESDLDNETETKILEAADENTTEDTDVESENSSAEASSSVAESEVVTDEPIIEPLAKQGEGLSDIVDAWGDEKEEDE